jgi:hypothetical protein
MVTDPLSDALEEASRQQPYVPDVEEALRRGRRLQIRRRASGIGAGIVAIAAIVTVAVTALPGTDHRTAVVQPAPVTSAPTPAQSSSPASEAPTTEPSVAPASPRMPADQSVVDQITKLPPATFNNTEPSTFIGALTPGSGAPLTVDGKPLVFWDGAEYCPFCAVERWPLVIALSRFGTWTGLSTITSASTDTPSDISTFSFYGASYASPYLTFQSVETSTNEQQGNYYKPLQTLTPDQTALVSQYDSMNGAIPFIAFGNAYTITGATYDYRVLQNKSPSQIATEISDTNTATSKTVITTANQLTAAICHITGNRPAAVCNTPPITALHH